MRGNTNAPAEARAPHNHLTRGHLSVAPPADVRALDEHVSLWASAAITNLRVAEWPAYGTAEWLRLPAADPRRAAAILAAAEMWRRYGDEQQLLEWFAAAHRARPPIDLPPAPRQRAAPRPLHATPGWPPVAIPGQPGKYLTYRVETAQ